MNDEPSEAISWRNRAISRSVDPARAAAEERVQRFLDTARELMQGGDSEELTVQNVVDRSGLSLRTFYHHFEGKYELLLALFEESVRTMADYLFEETQAIDDPVERLHRFTTEYYRVCRSGQPRPSDPLYPNRAMGRFGYRGSDGRG